MNKTLKTFAMLATVATAWKVLRLQIAKGARAGLNHLNNYMEVKALQERLREMQLEEYPKLSEDDKDKYWLRVHEILFEIDDLKK